jgi:CRP/FNR family transcriptional regulator
LKTGSSGREVTLDIVSPGEIFGEANLFVTNSAYGSSAEVLEDSIVYAIRRDSLYGAMVNNMDALKSFLALEVRRRHAAEQRLAEFVFYDVPTRLAHLLGRLASFYAEEGKNTGVMIRAKLTHQELANLVGSTRETTTLILNDFKRKKLIEFQGRKIVALDIEGLLSFESERAQRGSALEVA